MTAFALARRTASRYKARTLLALVGVAVISALNFDMLLLSRGLLLSFRDLIDSAGFDVRVLGSAGIPGLRLPVSDATSLADEIRRLPEVQDVALLRFDQAVATAPGRADDLVTVVGASPTTVPAPWTMTVGRNLPPGVPGEAPLVITRQLAEAFGVGPGSLLRLRVRMSGERSVLPPIECPVVGIADFSVEASGEFTAATTLEGLEAIRGGRNDRDADLVLVASRPGMGADAAVAAITRLRPDLRVYTNAELVEQFSRTNFAYFRQVSTVLSTTTALFTFLLVATLLTVSVNQRLGQIAALRAIGISRRRVASMLLWESALLVGVGGLAALPLGGGLASVLDGILRRMPGLPERLHFFVFEPRAVLLHGGLLVATAIVAAIYPIRLAVTLPIAQTLRREVVS